VAGAHPDTPILGPKFAEAFAFAAKIHAAQVRTGSRTPYIAHLMSVGALVLEYGGDEDCAIAGLLHDVAEDAPDGQAALVEIRARFGERVARIVRGCSDTIRVPGQPTPEWHRRKRGYLAHLAQADPDTLLVSACDKLTNARAIVSDLNSAGAAVWDRFATGSGEDQVWYYGALADIYAERLPGPLSEELARVVAQLRRRERELRPAHGG
jgi:(p)ppGpp synthase/HD superfamily hydrolase